MAKGAKYVGRPTAWGNPFATGDEFEEWLEDRLFDGAYIMQRLWILEHLDELRGLDLACWCPLRTDVRCHAEVLIEWANKPLPTRERALRLEIDAATSHFRPPFGRAQLERKETD